MRSMHADNRGVKRERNPAHLAATGESASRVLHGGRQPNAAASGLVIPVRLTNLFCLKTISFREATGALAHTVGCYINAIRQADYSSPNPGI